MVRIAKFYCDIIQFFCLDDLTMAVPKYTVIKELINLNFSHKYAEKIVAFWVPELDNLVAQWEIQ